MKQPVPFLHMRDLRKEKGMTQAELAKELDISRTTYSNYESGITQPDRDFLIQVADYFEVSIDYLCDHCEDRHGTKHADGFSFETQDEKDLVKAWRASDDDHRNIAAVALGFEYRAKEKDASAAS